MALDLTAKRVQDALGVSVDDLIADDLAVCQELAELAVEADFEAIHAPAAPLERERTLAVFGTAIKSNLGDVLDKGVRRAPIRMYDVLRAIRLPADRMSFAGRMPQSRWQVPPRWLARYQATGSLAYGFVLGLGLVTKAPYIAFLGSLILVAAVGTLPVAILAEWLYAAGRAVPLLVLGLLHPTTDYRRHAMALLRSTNLVRFVDRSLAIAVTVALVVAS